MSRILLQPLWLLILVMMMLSGLSCQGGKRYYPVRGHVFADGKPAEGVTIVFHPLDDSDPQPVQPSAVVQADGSFVLRSYVVQQRTLKEGAPAGKYAVTCVWYPADLQNYLGRENLPDKLHGKYADPKASVLRAEIPEAATELPPFEVKASRP